MSTRHLTDDALEDLCAGEHASTGSLARAHVRGCAECQARLTALQSLTTAATSAARAEADAYFPDARLDAQRRRILRRLAAQGVRAGRVLAFPAPSRPLALRLIRARPATRWIAAAAAAGLAIGVAVGRLSWDRPLGHVVQRPSARSVSGDTPRVSADRREDRGAMRDEELLSALETASSGPIALLQPIHELTPIGEQRGTRPTPYR